MTVVLLRARGAQTANSWSRPPVGCVKVNRDVDVLDHCNVGLGVVIRDDNRVMGRPVHKQHENDLSNEAPNKNNIRISSQYTRYFNPT